MRFYFEILIQNQKDCDKIITLLENHNFECEFFRRSDKSASLIKFESNYQEYEIFNSIEDLFEFDYQKIDKIGLGKHDFRINISRIQDMYVHDDWGRPYETNDSAIWYFVKPLNLKIVFPTKKINYLLNGKRKWVWLGVSRGHIPETGQKGYIVIVTEENSRKPISQNSCFTLIDKVFNTKEEAINGGIDYIKNLYGSIK